MSKGRITNHGDGRMLSCIGCTFRHRYGSTHFNGCVKCVERRQSPQRIATYITKDTRILVFTRHFIQRSIHIAMSAALAQSGRTTNDNRIRLAAFQSRQAQCRTHAIRRQFAHTRQIACQTSFDNNIGRYHAAQQFLDYRLPFFNHKDFFRTVCNQLVNHRHGQRILYDFQYTLSRRIILHQIVVAYSCSNNRLFGCDTFYIFIMSGSLAFLHERRLCSNQFRIVALRERRQKNEVLHILRERHRILRSLRCSFHHRP